MTATPAVPVDLPAHHAWLDAECRRLLAFGARSALPGGGAAYLDTTGEPDLTRGVLTWITARSTHAYSCLLYTSPSPRDQRGSRMPSSA